MKTLDRYLLREILGPFVVGLVLLFVVVSFAQILKISDSVTGLGVSGSEILQALAYSFPPLMGLLLPVAVLFATLIGVGRLATDGEILAMHSVGVPPVRLLKMPALVGALIGLLCAYALLVGEPWGIRGLKSLMARSAQAALARGVRVGEFNEWIKDVAFLARGEKNGQLTDIMIADHREPKRPLVISARRGRVRPGAATRDIVFDLEEGSILLYDSREQGQRTIRFEDSQYRLDVGGLVTRKLRTATGAQAMDPGELWVESRNPERSTNQRAQYAITLQRKVALPVATVLFALLAVPLANRKAAGARARGFLFSAAIVGGYYYLGRALELSARSGDLPAWLAAWGPNFVGVIGLVWLMIRARRVAA